MGNSDKDIVKLIREPGKSTDVTAMTNTALIQARLGLFDAKQFKIIVEEENLACWIALNNTFTRIGTSVWDKAVDYWNGVLFQLGGYYGLGTTAPMFNLQAIVFEKEDGTEVDRLNNLTAANTPDEFAKDMYWINVVAKKTSDTRRHPMGLHDLSRLRLDPPEPIHRYFDAYMGGLTFWHDRDDGYTLEATKNGFHNKYTFSFPVTDALTIEVYKDDKAVTIQNVADVATIRLVPPGGGDPGDAMNPPQRPGGDSGFSKGP